MYQHRTSESKTYSLILNIFNFNLIANVDFREKGLILKMGNLLFPVIVNYIVNVFA